MSRAAQIVRKMSGGVKGIRYKPSELNKAVEPSKRGYGIPNPVINRRSISIDYHKQDSIKDKSKIIDKSINSYIQGNYHFQHIKPCHEVSGKDCKEYVSFLMTCDNKTGI